MLRDNDSEMGHLTRDTSSDAVCKEYHGGSHQDQNLRQRKKGLEPAWMNTCAPEQNAGASSSAMLAESHLFL